MSTWGHNHKIGNKTIDPIDAGIQKFYLYWFKTFFRINEILNTYYVVYLNNNIPDVPHVEEDHLCL